MKQTALGLWYPEDADPPDGPTQTKELAEAADGLLQAGGVAESIYVASATRTSTSFGSFTTPVKLTLPVVKKYQVIEIALASTVRCSETTNASKGCRQRVMVGADGGTTTEGSIIRSGQTELAADQRVLMNTYYLSVRATEEALGDQELTKFGLAQLYALHSLLPPAPIQYLAAEDMTSVVIEWQAKSITAGTVTIGPTLMIARVRG